MPVDSPQIFACWLSSLPPAPASNSTHHKQSLNCHSTGALSVTQHPELIRTKTQSHLQLCSSLGHQGQFLSGAFCLPALYSQLCPLPATPIPPATWTLQQPPSWQPAPISARDLKNCKPQSHYSPGSTVSRQSLGRQHAGRPAPCPVSLTTTP